ncbi:hypothetical protein CFC21_073929 [Triticum aestivum]|uniref:Uncharacterized protein n=2 Tax=Triticum aestivum TaxID=4565 RepID=A0A3B6LUQ5_WHEAT|nr:phenolic glucoside malonyltransferase 1-like [Triticum aestivum]KAF7068152.1 hypothetical protein CFC21_073929 [Triticum aestivum]
MPPTVRTRNTFAVQLPAGVPLRDPGRTIPLSPFDAYWVALPPVRRVFQFRPPPGAGIPFADVVRALASSLERVIPAFHPFAGALTYSPESRAVSIVLPEGACGVAFVEAEADIKFERLVVEGTEHDEDALLQLVPDIKRDELPAPLMAVQVTEFLGGGVAVGVTVHHAVADGRGLWAFLEMWAAAAGVQEGRVATSPTPTPLHDRRLVSFCGDEELSRLFLLQVAPELPIIRKQNPAPEQGSPLCRRTFTFAAPTVRLLKQRLTVAGTGKAPSTFASLAAHGWVSIARAKGFTDDALVFTFFLADCRVHMSPSVPGAYSGNCVAGCLVSLRGSDLTGANGHARAVQAIAEAVKEVKRDPLGDSTNWRSKFAAIPPGRAVILAGSPWFPAYGIDFGFGKPARVELASMNHDGEMVLVAGREAGSVQASVAITQDKMTAFRDMFVLGSN